MQGLNSVMRTLLPLFLEQERKKSRALSHIAYVRTYSARSCEKGVKEEGRGGGEEASQGLKAKEEV